MYSIAYQKIESVKLAVKFIKIAPEKVISTMLSHFRNDFEGKFCHATFSTPLSPTRSSLATSCYGKNYTQVRIEKFNAISEKIAKKCKIKKIIFSGLRSDFKFVLKQMGLLRTKIVQYQRSQRNRLF